MGFQQPELKPAAVKLQLQQPELSFSEPGVFPGAADHLHTHSEHHQLRPAETGGAEEAAAATPPAAEFQLKQLLPQLPLRNWTRGEGGGSWHLPGGVQHWQEVDHPAWRIPCLTILPMSSFFSPTGTKIGIT